MMRGDYATLTQVTHNSYQMAVSLTHCNELLLLKSNFLTKEV